MQDVAGLSCAWYCGMSCGFDSAGAPSSSRCRAVPLRKASGGVWDRHAMYTWSVASLLLALVDVLTAGDPDCLNLSTKLYPEELAHFILFFFAMAEPRRPSLNPSTRLGALTSPRVVNIFLSVYSR